MEATEVTHNTSTSQRPGGPVIWGLGKQKQNGPLVHSTGKPPKMNVSATWKWVVDSHPVAWAPPKGV